MPVNYWIRTGIITAFLLGTPAVADILKIGKGDPQVVERERARGERARSERRLHARSVVIAAGAERWRRFALTYHYREHDERQQFDARSQSISVGHERVGCGRIARWWE